MIDCRSKMALEYGTFAQSSPFEEKNRHCEILINAHKPLQKP